jgi:tetrahydromethanopterin S-methyltransferase subunit G
MSVTVRESWTDERLDDFKERVDQRFDEVDRRFDDVDKRFDKVDARLDRIDGRLDSMGRAFVFGAIAMSSTMVAGFGAMVAVIATKL